MKPDKERVNSPFFQKCGVVFFGWNPYRESNRLRSDKYYFLPLFSCFVFGWTMKDWILPPRKTSFAAKTADDITAETPMISTLDRIKIDRHGAYRANNGWDEHTCRSIERVGRVGRGLADEERGGCWSLSCRLLINSLIRFGLRICFL